VCPLRFTFSVLLLGTLGAVPGCNVLADSHPEHRQLRPGVGQGEVRGVSGMPVAQEFDIPPRALLGHVLGAVIGHVTGAMHRLDPVAAVPREPFPPDVRPFQVFEILFNFRKE
jgi:hypothetical protein